MFSTPPDKFSNKGLVCVTVAHRGDIGRLAMCIAIQSLGHLGIWNLRLRHTKHVWLPHVDQADIIGNDVSAQQFHLFSVSVWATELVTLSPFPFYQFAGCGRSLRLSLDTTHNKHQKSESRK